MGWFDDFSFKNSSIFLMKILTTCHLHIMSVRRKFLFLDLYIRVNSNGQLSSILFRKTILHYDSFHLSPLKRWIPFSQYLRQKQNCLNEETFKIKADKLIAHLRSRGYGNTFLNKTYKKTLENTRESQLFNKKDRMDSDVRRVITGFHNQHHDMRAILRRH